MCDAGHAVQLSQNLKIPQTLLLMPTKRGIEHQFVEAVIYIPLFGHYAREYVTECI